MNTGGVIEDVAAAAESVRRWVDTATWTAIGLGLAFTAVNVQTFAAAGAPVWSPGWLVAWLLDPMVSVLLLAVVRAEQVTARWQVSMGWQVGAVKWAAFAATYCMNTWSAWRDGIPSSVLLHSVPPVFVLLAAEVAPALRDRLTEAVRTAEQSTATRPPHPVKAPTDAPQDDQRPAATPWPPSLPPRPHGPPTPWTAPSSGTPHGRPASETAPTSAPTASTEGRPAAPLNDDSTAAQGEAAAGPDARVVGIAELLADGCDVTGAQVAAIHGGSERTGRRLLADARTHLAQHPSLARPDLHLVEARTGGGTA